MMIVACGRPSRSARMTPVCANPWSSDCRPVRIRSNDSPFIAAASALGDSARVRIRQAIVGYVDGAIGAARERFANHLCHARGPGRADHDFAVMLFLEPQRLFERVRVGLVHLEAGVLIADPGASLVETRLPVSRRNLFDADRDAHRHRLALIALEEQRGVRAAEAEGVRQRVRDGHLRASRSGGSRGRTPHRASSRLIVGGAT